MGVWIVVAANEPIALAFRRFQRLSEQLGVDWEIRKRGLLIQPNGCKFKAAATRRAKKFKKRFKVREATMLAKKEGMQPSNASSFELQRAFWKRRRKP